MARATARARGRFELFRARPKTPPSTLSYGKRGLCLSSKLGLALPLGRPGGVQGQGGELALDLGLNRLVYVLGLS